MSQPRPFAVCPRVSCLVFALHCASDLSTAQKEAAMKLAVFGAIDNAKWQDRAGR